MDKELTYEEALERVKKSHCIAMAMLCEGRKDIETENALKKLEEVIEKATPKRPITIKPEGTSIFDYPTNRIKCPNCGNQLPMKKNCLKKKNPINYCNRCGQKLDWGDCNE